MADDLIHEDRIARRFDLRLWARVLRYARPYRRYMVGLGAAALVVAACDAAIPLMIKAVIDHVVAGGPDPYFWLKAGGFALLCFIFAGAVFGFILLGGRIASHMAHDIRRAGFERLQQLSFSYYDRHNVGWLMARLTSDTDRLSRIIGWALLDLLWGVCLLIAIAIMLLVLDWVTGAALLLIVPGLVVVSAIFQRRILTASRQTRKINSHLTAEFNEGISGIRTTKALVREQPNLEGFKRETGAMFDASMSHALNAAMYLPLIMVLVCIGEAIAIVVGANRAMGGMITLGTLVGFIYYAKLLPEPIRETARNLTDMLGAQAAAERVMQLIDTEPEIADSAEVVDRMRAHAASPHARDPRYAPDGMADRIETVTFENVSFAYNPGEPVLEDFHLELKRGRTVALVGPTGGGKSTIVNLLCRFYEPTAGRILIDGVDYRERSLAWFQSRMGIVLQTPHLFAGTVRENIRYGRIEASDAEVEYAAKLVGADPFIRHLEHGYDTDVGQAGNRLSTGQKQLVSFARAIIADPPILIMDEATSSIDTETEQVIQRGLSRVLEGRISIVIAHRLSTIRNAGQILVIDGGRIIESGSHQQLITRRGHYYQLYTGQFTREHERQILGAPLDENDGVDVK